MIRKIVPTGRIDEETWVDYIQRATYKAEAVMAEHRSIDWVTMYKTTKWKFAGETARRTDERWNTLLLRWKPFHGTGRPRGHPQKRWRDDLDKYAGEDWPTHALDKDLWSVLESGFIQFDEL